MELEAFAQKIEERFALLERRFEETQKDARREFLDDRKDAARQRESLAREMGEVSSKINWMTAAIGEMRGGAQYQRPK